MIFENKPIFDGVAGAKGMIRKAQSITDAQNAFETIRNSGFKKAEFALELLYLPNFDDIKVPTYISESLKWLEDTLEPKRRAPVPLSEDNAGAGNAE